MTKKMLKGTEKALNASIEHWIKDGPKGVEMGSKNCALCQRFNDWNGTGCIRITGKGFETCPVHEATGIDDCAGTPYVRYPDADDVTAEIKSLKSLLPGAA